MGINRRIVRLLSAIATNRVETVRGFIDQGNSTLERRVKEWEERLGINSDEPMGRETYDRKENEEARASSQHDTYPEGFVDDLRLFHLLPPSCLEEVKKARNREMKKFHPDHFPRESEKAETAKRITQIYNLAYERLKNAFAKVDSA